TSPGYGGLLLLAYSVGFALPFIGMAYALGSVRKLAQYSLAIERVGGAVMVVMGIMLATGTMERLSAWLLEVTGFTGF
uniref:cytochrome c biogenesis protein CcdA n=1 Tax=Symbiobacterium terraclitae TaxID=557451 RepID=UPI0035B52B77